MGLMTTNRCKTEDEFAHYSFLCVGRQNTQRPKSISRESREGRL